MPGPEDEDSLWAFMIIEVKFVCYAKQNPMIKVYHNINTICTPGMQFNFNF